MYKSLWGNPLIVAKLFYPSLARAGFQTIKDIFHKPLPASRTVATTLYESHVYRNGRKPFRWPSIRPPSRGRNNCLCLRLPISRNLTINRQIHYRLRDEVISTCRDKWQISRGRPINITMWGHLWLPHGFQLITPYFRDILWNFLRRVLYFTHKGTTREVSFSGQFCLSGVSKF